MAPTTEPPVQPVDDCSVMGATTITGLDIVGTVPVRLSGRLIGIGSGPEAEADHSRVHSVHLHGRRVISYRSRLVRTDVVISNTVVFGGSILALGADSFAYELRSDLDTFCRVDLAGQYREVAAYPRSDPVTGELHLVATAGTGAQAHVVVSAGALTRRSCPIDGAPNRVTDLAITRDRVVFVADGSIGVTPRAGETRISWIATGVDAPTLVNAHDVGATVVVLALTPSLERWTLDVASATVEREVLDPTPSRVARTPDHPFGADARFVWSIGDASVDKFDLTAGSFVSHTFRADHRPEDLVYVTDPARRSDADGGWLVGFVHHAARDETDFVVLDAADISRPAFATVRIPLRIPRGLHSTWIPSTHQ
jgi:carotenoid cleavage dioxygenase